MALLDISLVTQALLNLIQYSFQASEAWIPAGSSPPVSPLPPDILKSESVGLYLYHIKEDNQYKNLPSPGSDVPPVRYTPMGLTFYYQLTAHSKLDSDQATINEQKMMGIAIKALHDYPLIDDHTGITDLNNVINQVFPSDLMNKDNKLRILLQPIDHQEALTYWSAGTLPHRLAMYYQVSVVLLEPEESKTRPGRVLSYGVNLLTGTGPRIENCSNLLSFKIPPLWASREIELTPARVPVGEQVLFTVTGFDPGTADLLLINARWEAPVRVDPVTWALVFSSKGASITIRETIVDEKGNTLAILPGIYSACIRVPKVVIRSDGTSQTFMQLSNEFPFAVTPRIDTPILSGSKATDKTLSGYLFSYKEPPVMEEQIRVQIYVGSNSYLQGSGSGTFTVDSSSQLTVHLAADLISGNTYPLRVIVNGIESPPSWISIT